MGTNANALPQDDLARLLAKTSRTFALAIPLLDDAAGSGTATPAGATATDMTAGTATPAGATTPHTTVETPASLARQVGVAYLLFRLADELEDAPLWERDRRAMALASFTRWLDDASDGLAWKRLVAEAPPTTHEGCLELLSRADDVLASARAFDDRVATSIVTHTKRTARGMSAFVARQDEHGAIALTDVADLQQYAYVVAGIVGELLTDLFAFSDPRIEGSRATLDAHARAFGEGLQLVNILKDADADAREGRAYLPRGIARASVVELARQDLRRAGDYVTTLVAADASPGVIAFCDLPVRLAVATLDRLEQGVPKLGREEVLQIYAAVTSRGR